DRLVMAAGRGGAAPVPVPVPVPVLPTPATERSVRAAPTVKGLHLPPSPARPTPRPRLRSQAEPTPEPAASGGSVLFWISASALVAMLAFGWAGRRSTPAESPAPK